MMTMEEEKQMDMRDLRRAWNAPTLPGVLVTKCKKGYLLSQPPAEGYYACSTVADVPAILEDLFKSEEQ